MTISAPFIPPTGNYGAELFSYINEPEQGQQEAFTEYFDDNFYGTNMPFGWEKFIMLGYLQSLWQNLVQPVRSTVNFGQLYGIQGAGRISFGDPTQQNWLLQIVRIHVTTVPPNIDTKFGVPNNFGDLPWQILGRCGWMDGGYYGETKFLNHTQASFVPDRPASSGFWYLLNPGVQANIYAEAKGSYERGCLWLSGDAAQQQPEFRVDNINYAVAPQLQFATSPPPLFPWGG